VRASTRRWRHRRKGLLRRNLHAVIRPRLLLLALIFALAGAAAPAGAATTYTDISQFRADAHGREVTWDDKNGAVPPDVYSGQGLVFNAGGDVSGGVFHPTTNPVTASFVLPGSSTTALVRGFGVLFSSPDASSKIELLDGKGQVLDSAQPQDHFVGILLNDGRVAKVRITGSPLDNMLYTEPMQDIDGDGIAENDPDADGDGIPNERDAFPLDKKESVDTDGDGTGDNEDTDDDNDGVPDAVEARRGTDPKRVDTDGDGVHDGQDNCPLTPNADQADGNGDGQGDACSDLFPPVLSNLALRPARFQPGAKRGTRVSFRVSEPATVELRVLRVVGARRPPVSGSIERHATAGTNLVRFNGRIGGHDLKPGRYVLMATAEDDAGNVAFQAPRARFTVLR
jgi:Thrombospondin type 3 repeat